MPEGVAFDFMDLPQGADIWFFPFPRSGSLTYWSEMKACYTWYYLEIKGY